MVTSGLSIKLFDFQEKAVIKLIDLTSKKDSKQTIIMKAPTGSGKTIILIDYVDTYLTNVSANTAFIWLCPGKGNLEEQSREKMMKFAPGRTTQNLFDALLNGFTPGSTTFINWELVTKRGNTAIRDSERKNLFDRIADAHRAGVEFIVIIDEEHSNNTAKAKTIIDAFASKNIVRVSATAIENKRYEFFEIDEVDVIDAGLITKALYVNEGVADNTEITDDYDYLLDLADAKRKAIAGRYKEIGKNIRPLVLIQFPNGQPETITAVEQKLESMGYTYDNGMVSKWMSEDKKDLGMKQRLAIARAILTKPELLILDEPINALDPEGIREMRELFRKLNTDYGITIFISSHILSEVEQIADTIGVIQSGKLMKEISMSDVHKFQTDYVEVEVDNIELAGYVLEHECGIRNFKIVSENRIEIYDLGKAVKEISALLVQNGVGINSIGRKQNSLEDYFFQITGTEVVGNL